MLFIYILLDKYILSQVKSTTTSTTTSTTSTNTAANANNNNNINNININKIIQQPELKVNNNIIEDNENVAQVLSRVSHYPSFWLMLVAKMNLLMVGQFISFIPIYLSTAPTLLLSPQISAQSSSTFAVSGWTSSWSFMCFFRCFSWNFKMFMFVFAWNKIK